MSPWDELGYFKLPKESFFSGVAPGSQLALANPMRVSLSMINAGAGASIFVSLTPTGNNARGFVLTTQTPNIVLTAKDHPGLVQAAWFLSGSAPANSVTVVEVEMTSWPERKVLHALQSPNRRALRDNRPHPYKRTDTARISEALRGLWDALPGLR